MSDRTQRRLAAIVSADVVGYSRLMGSDESGTLERLRSHRSELIDPLIEHHGGRIVKTTGDGMLLEFPSIVAAVECTAAVQEGMAERNAGIGEDQALRFRVGVHLGDVIVEGDDIFGDGVNVAARLEALADPYGLALSDDAYRQVRDRLDLAWQDEGEHEVKNIARPVHVWRWSLQNTSAKDPVQPAHGETPPQERPSIAVLPFENMSRDPEHEYFADGVAEDIITALSKLPRMRIIARNSTFVYKGRAHDLRQVAKELGVRFVLEGSVRSGGNRLRITAQLIDANDGSHLWAERFDRTIDDIFDIQDEITKEIVTALRVNLTEGDEAAILARGTSNIEAWQLCGRAYEIFERFSSVEYLEARSLAEKAVQLDPNYAYAWATLGLTHWYEGRLGYTPDAKANIARARECAERAMALDETVTPVIALNVHLAGIENRQEEGLAIARRGVELYPSSANVRAFLGFALFRVGGYREGAEHLRAAISLNPFYPNWYRNSLVRNLMMLGELEEALSLAELSQRIETTNLTARLSIAYIYGKLGRAEDAKTAVKDVTQLAPNLRLEHVPGNLMINVEADAQHILDVLRDAGFPE